MPRTLTGWEQQAYDEAWATALVALTDYALRTLDQPDARLEGELMVLAARHKTPNSAATNAFRLAATKLMWAASIRLQEKALNAWDRLMLAASQADEGAAALIRAAAYSDTIEDLVKVVEYPSEGDPAPTATLVSASARVTQTALTMMAHPTHSSTADLWAELGCISARVGWH